MNTRSPHSPLLFNIIFEVLSFNPHLEPNTKCKTRDAGVYVKKLNYKCPRRKK